MVITKNSKEFNNLLDYVKSDIDYYKDFIITDFNLNNIDITDSQINQAVALINLNDLNSFDNEGFDYDTDFVVLNDNNEPVDTEQLSSLILDNLESIIESDLD